MAFPIKALLASGALLLSSGAALAASATATTNANVRSGPGQNYQVIDVLPEGETVNLVGCDDAWCEISMGQDGTGFVLGDLLDFNGRVPAASYGEGPVVIEQDDPTVIRGLVIGGYWDSRPYYIRDGYYYWGGRWYGARPGLRGWRERSWRRWDDRRPWGDRKAVRPGGTRGDVTNRPPRAERPRFDRDDRGGRGDGRDRGDRGDRGGRAERDGRIERGSDGRNQRMERREERQQSRQESRDRGDRMGLDRAGGGGRGDGGGRGGRGEGGGRGER